MDDVPPIPAASPPALVSRRALLVVRIFSGLSVVGPGVLVLGSALAFFPLGLIPAAGFIWAVYSLDSKLRGPEPKQGLALAVWIGLASFLFLVAYAVVASVGFLFWDRLTIAAVAGVVLPVVMVGAAIQTYRTAGHEPGDFWLLVGGLFQGMIYLAALLIPAAIVLPGLLRSRIASNQASAVGALRRIHTAMITYQSTYQNGFAPSLGALGPAPTHGVFSPPDCSAAGLIDEVLASGRRSRYVFELKPGPRLGNPRPGCPPGVESYALSARPRPDAGTASYHADDTGVIRSTDEDRPATTADPPLGGFDPRQQSGSHQ